MTFTLVFFYIVYIINRSNTTWMFSILPMLRFLTHWKYANIHPILRKTKAHTVCAGCYFYIFRMNTFSKCWRRWSIKLQRRRYFNVRRWHISSLSISLWKDTLTKYATPFVTMLWCRLMLLLGWYKGFDLIMYQDFATCCLI